MKEQAFHSAGVLVLAGAVPRSPDETGYIWFILYLPSSNLKWPGYPALFFLGLQPITSTPFPKCLVPPSL